LDGKYHMTSLPRVRRLGSLLPLQSLHHCMRPGAVAE
jgi:hypothetical protein